MTPTDLAQKSGVSGRTIKGMRRSMESRQAPHRAWWTLSRHSRPQASNSLGPLKTVLEFGCVLVAENSDYHRLGHATPVREQRPHFSGKTCRNAGHPHSGPRPACAEEARPTCLWGYPRIALAESDRSAYVLIGSNNPREPHAEPKTHRLTICR
jgi:hypothetical protein